MNKDRKEQIQERTSQILRAVVQYATEHNLGKLTQQEYKDSHNRLIAELCHDITSLANESLVIDDVLRLEENYDKLEYLFAEYQIIGLELGYDIPI